MSDDSGGILSEIADVAGDVAGEAVDELAKFGKSAASQISGHAGGTGQSAKADISKVKSAVAGSTGDQSAEDVVRGFGKSLTSQITGHTADLAGNEIAKMAKTDNKFSQVESLKIKAKINQIYQEHAAKRAREEQRQEVVQKQQEEQLKQLQEAERKEDLSANPAIAKTRAEIKNYGAE